jgi:hypothetical protein
MLIIPNHVKWLVHEIWGIKIKFLLNSILGFALRKEKTTHNLYIK